MQEWTDKEWGETAMSVSEKVTHYMAEVEGYCEKVESLPCVEK